MFSNDAIYCFRDLSRYKTLIPDLNHNSLFSKCHFKLVPPQFIEGQFKEDSAHTIGVEFGSKIVPVGGKTVKLQIWDTAGQVNTVIIFLLLQTKNRRSLQQLNLIFRRGSAV